MIMGNAVPGVVLGILIGKGVDDSGWNRVTKTLITSVILLFVLSAFFRGFDVRLLESMYITPPEWLLDFHKLLGLEVK
ncbi:Uncharacterised protein [Mycobacteroides abscessus subsp. abscessus]|nr:Uncharacterised protein [Mycobacteroides abscessus subsp. abscessus]